MSTITYTINIENDEHPQFRDWQVSPTILKGVNNYLGIETMVEFNKFERIAIPFSSTGNHKEPQVEKAEIVNYSERIVLPTVEGIHLIDVSKIIRLEADKNYTTVHIEGQKPLLISKTLKDVEQQLDPKIFFRIHQSHTVDIKKIEIYHRGRGGSVTLRNGESLPVSKNKKEALLRILM